MAGDAGWSQDCRRLTASGADLPGHVVQVLFRAVHANFCENMQPRRRAISKAVRTSGLAETGLQRDHRGKEVQIVFRSNFSSFCGGPARKLFTNEARIAKIAVKRGLNRLPPQTLKAINDLVVRATGGRRQVACGHDGSRGRIRRNACFTKGGNVQPLPCANSCGLPADH